MVWLQRDVVLVMINCYMIIVIVSIFFWGYRHVFCVAKDCRRLQNDLSYVQEAITWRLIDRIAPWFFIL